VNLVVFDLDGTLTRTLAVDGDCYLQAFDTSLGIKDVNDTWSEYEHVTDLGVMQDVFQSRFGRAPDPNDIAAFVDCFVGLLRHRYESAAEAFGEIPGATAFLARLRHATWGVAIATGGWERSARFKIDAARLAAGHIPAAFAEDGPARHAIVQAAIARAETYYREKAFHRVVLVGDAIWDLRCAQTLGLPFVAVAHPDRATHLRELGASHVIEHFIDQNRCFRCLDEARVPGRARPRSGYFGGP
jgi:phosphoglycolate phosphatase-like HAD superfamily hydrolase